MYRFKRDYTLKVTLDNETITIKPPLRITFEVSKSIYGGLNKANIKIYNLKDVSRHALIKDPEQNKFISVNLEAGYESISELIFQGSMYRGFLLKESNDLCNNLESFDGYNEYTTNDVSATVLDSNLAINEILKAMKTIKKGKIAERKKTIRPLVLYGNAGQMLEKQKEDDDILYIDNETLYILKDNQYLGGFVSKVSAETGLLNTPQKENKRVTMDTLLDPGIKLAGLVDLASVSAPWLNGIYRVEQIVYRCDFNGDDWYQSITGTLAEGYNKL